MNVEPVIRIAIISDAAEITNCVEAAYRHYISRIGKPPGPMLDDYSKVIEKHIVFVAIDEGIVGVLVLIRDPESILLDNVAVHPEYQGRGLGMRLIEHAELEAIERGYEKIQLYTHETMTENFEMYKSLGYQETMRKNVHGYDRIYFEKQLTFRELPKGAWRC